MSPARKNLLSNIISLVIRTGFVLFLIPFYINNLGNELYSDWIILYTLPAIFELTNFGINQAVNNTFSISYNQKEEMSEKIITHGLYFTFSIGLIISSLILLSWEWLGLFEFLNIVSVNQDDSKLIVYFLTLKVFLDMIRGILSSYLFANNLNHFTIYINTIQYVLESLIIISLLLTGKTLVLISSLLLIPSLISCLGLLIINTKKFKYYFDLNFDVKYIKILLKPSYSFSLLSISEYILNQGFLIVLKKYYLSESLIIFNSAKTLTNYIKQIQALISTSVFPVFNVYYGKNKLNELFSLYFKSRNITFIITAIICCLLYVFGESIWNIWLSNTVYFDITLFNILLLIQLIGSIWIISSNLIISTNNHLVFSQLYLVSSIFSVVIFYLFSNLLLISFSLVPVFYMVHHIIMLFYSNYKLKSILN